MARVRQNDFRKIKILLSTHAMVPYNRHIYILYVLCIYGNSTIYLN